MYQAPKPLVDCLDCQASLLLTSNPHAALAEAGVEVPAGMSVKVMENTADTAHVVLPVAPNKAGEMSIDELEKVAGGDQQHLEDIGQTPTSGP